MKANFDALINDVRPVIVDFHALWCGPCKAQSPILQEIAAELGERVKVIKVDIDQNIGLANRFNIRSVPTVMVFVKGQERYKQAGVHSKAQLLQILSDKI
jgi:thioredoxin 1